MADTPRVEILPPDSVPKDGDDSLGYWSRNVIPEAEMRMRVAVVVALRAQGSSYAEIETQTKLTKRQIAYCMRHAYEAKIALAQIQHRLDNVAVPLAVEGLVNILEDDEHDRHYDAIRDTLYGRGEFRNHSHSVNDNRNTTLTLTVEYEMTQGGKIPDVVQVTEASGLMVGRPREDDGDNPPRY